MAISDDGVSEGVVLYAHEIKSKMIKFAFYATASVALVTGLVTTVILVMSGVQEIDGVLHQAGLWVCAPRR